MSYRLLALCGLVVALSGCEKAPPPEKLIRPVLTRQVEIQPYYQEASYAGEVRAHHETVLGFRVNGKIVERNVEVGDTVKPGDVLARLDDEDNTLRLTEAEAGLAAAKAERNKAAADLKRHAALLDKKAISTADYQDFVNDFDVAKARLKQAEARLEVTRNQAEYTALTSDQAGVITAVEGEVGQVVAAGQTVLRLALAEEKEVRIAVPENRLGELKRADEISIRLWADPDTRYRGRVREISPGADPVTRTYSAKITLLYPSPEVQLGMTATVTIIHRLGGTVARLPLTSIFQKEDQPAVWVVAADTGAVSLAPVEVAQYEQDAVVISSGLSQGQHVVTAGVHKLIPGQKVRLLVSPRQ